jgi:hypothetical protein
MKKNIILASLCATAALSAALTLTSCSSTPKGEATTTAAYQEGVPGGVVVNTFKTTATVTGIDTANRKVTLVSPDGKKTVYTAGPEVINFDQIRVGDQLKVTVAEQLVVFLAEKGAPPPTGTADLVALAPKGAKPGGLMVSTTQITAKVKAIDLKNHKATLEFPDGKSQTFPVRKDVDLTQRKVGEEVVIRTTDALAISVEKP